MSILLMICNKVPRGLEAARRDNEQGEKNFFDITRLFLSHLFVKNLFLVIESTIVIAETSGVSKTIKKR